MAKVKREFRITYYVACYHFLTKNQEEIISISEDIENLYSVETDFEIKWPKNKKKAGTEIDFYISSEKHTKLQLSQFVETLHDKIQNSSFGKLVEILNDESSNYLTQSMFPNLGKIEVGLRSIFKKVLISVFGPDWKKKIFDDNFKSKRNEKEIESLTLEELYYIMFVNRRFLPLTEDVELSKKTKEELLDLIKSQNILTFWELFFPKIKLKEKVCEIIRYRNQIMHFKGVKYSDYSHCKKLWTQIIPLIEKANKELEMESMVTLLAEQFKKIDFSIFKSALLTLAKEMNKMVSGFYNKDKS